MKDYKVCKKGTGLANGFNGCNKSIKTVMYGKSNFRYGLGLSCKCFSKWLMNTEAGNEVLNKTKIAAKKKVEKESKVKRKYVKWTDKPLNEMIQYVQDNIVNPYIRARDIDEFTIYGSISGGGKISDAGHFFNVKNSGMLRFCIQNIHGQSYSHNRDTADPGHLIEYREGLINRFGEKYIKELESIKVKSKGWPKLTRVDLIEIGKTYEHLTKKKLWCFSHEQFNNYKNILNK